MATIESVMTKIRNLISKANSTTGRTDSELTSAVNALVEGYGKGGVEPQGSITIVQNGTYDVTEKAEAVVNVPSSGITPTGSLTVTENGTFDVTTKASVVVNVPTPAQNFHLFPFALSSAWTGTAKEHTLLTANAFVKEHYADEGFFAMWIPLDTPDSAEAGVAGWIYQSNRPMIKTAITAHAVFARSTSPTANPGWMPNAQKLNGTGYNVSLRAKSNGNLTMYRSASYTIPAGNYLLLIGLAE